MQLLLYLIRHIVHHDDAVRPSVVAGGDGSESLLPSRVPLEREEGKEPVPSIRQQVPQPYARSKLPLLPEE